MGDSLAGSKPSESYNGILKTSDNTAVSASKKTISDGEGNDTGLGVSDDKVFANKLRIENPDASSADEVVLVRNTSTGDVKTRSINSFVFNTSLQERLFAKTSGAQVSPVQFKEIGTDSGDSFVVGENISINGSSNGVTVTGSGALVKATANVKLKFVQNDASVALTINQNGSAITTQNSVNTFASSSSEEIVVFSTPIYTSTSADEITLTFSETSGDVRVLEDSFLDIEKIS